MRFLRRAWRWTARADVAAVLMALVIVLAAIGSLFPQWGPGLTAERRAQWEALLQMRYGGLTDLLITLGAFRLFSSPLFVGLVCALTLATAICALNRWPGLWRATRPKVSRPADALLDAAPYVAGGTVSAAAELPARAQRWLAHRGYRVIAQVTANETYLWAERNTLARLASPLGHLAVVLLLAGGVVSAALGWRAELTLAPGQVAAVPGTAKVTIRNDGFTIPRYPDGSPADYRAHLRVAGPEHTIVAVVAVNRPLAVAGVRLYLTGYQATDAGEAVALLAVHDPGYSLVVAGGVMLLLGMAGAIAFPRCTVHVRIAADGTLHLAGFADRGAMGFGREFARLTQELTGG